MIEKLRSSEDRGVSPVVGVILMVAITVILAAVVATFVIDMGSDVGQTAPTIQGQISDTSNEYQIDSTGSAFDIAHEGGEQLETSKMKVVVRDSSGSAVLRFESGSWSGVSNGMDTWELQLNSQVVDGSGTWGVGDTMTIVKSSDSGNSTSELHPDNTYEIQVVHTESNSLILTHDIILA